MDVSAIEKMEYFAKQVLRLSEKRRNEFFEALKTILTEEEILALKKYVGLYHLMTDPVLYKAMEKSLGEQLYKEFMS